MAESKEPSKRAFQFGLGLREPHFWDGVVTPISAVQSVDFWEILVENFIHHRGAKRDLLRTAGTLKPLAFHGVSLSIGSESELRDDYLKLWCEWILDFQPTIVSDHLCFTAQGSHNSHDLLPLPYTHAVLQRVAHRVCRLQDLIGLPLTLENPSSYLQFENRDFSESQFLAELCQRTGCQLLLDLNNVHVTCKNFGWSSQRYLADLPMNQVRQIHLAGHTVGPNFCYDTHDQDVSDDVWQLYRTVLPLLPNATHILIERDEHIPPLSDLIGELNLARTIAEDVFQDRAGDEIHGQL